MKKSVRNVAAKLIKTISFSDIVGKQIKGTDQKLYYEPAQHLIFFLKREIEYEKKIQSEIKKYIKQGDLIFDIGANIGQYALFFSNLAGEAGKVYSFEPDFKTFSFLVFNKNINRSDNLHCNNYGIGKFDGEQDFFRDTETGGRTGSFIKDYVGANYKGFKDTVRLKKFDSIIIELGCPNFVKIDVEGLEEDVFNGLSINLDKCTFLVEVRKETKKYVFNYFHQRGYKCLWVDHDEMEIEDIDTIPNRTANLVFLKSS